ncbi:hypothetical protein [Moraxella lacunata]|uniref:hypothetical protein n=1 Tax=Moraxella lacunata TaxID=477 RepID=UPI003EE1BA29
MAWHFCRTFDGSCCIYDNAGFGPSAKLFFITRFAWGRYCCWRLCRSNRFNQCFCCRVFCRQSISTRGVIW